MRVHVKLFLFFLAACLLLTGIGMTVNRILLEEAQQQSRSHIQNQILLSTGLLETRLHALDDQLHALCVSPDVNLFACYDRAHQMGEISELAKSLHWQLTTLRGSFPMAENFFLIFPRQQRQITSNTRYEEISEQLLAHSSPDGGSVWIDDASIYIARPLPVDKVYKLGSQAVCSLSVHQLFTQLTAGLDQKMSMRLLFNGQALITHGGLVWGAEPGLNGWHQEDGGWSLICPIQITTLGDVLHFEVFLPDHALVLIDQSYTVWSVLLVVLLLLALIVFTSLLRRIVSHPLSRFLEAFAQLAHGDMSVQIHHQARDEFSDLYDQFNGMVHSMRESIEGRYLAELSARRAELKQLQTQIHPHFLYNAFYQLYRLCKMEGSDEAADFSMLLSQYYAYITRTPDGDGLCPLEQEYEHAARYARIQRFRYGESLAIDFEPLDARTKDIRVPKLLIQPVVENAVKHCYEKAEAPVSLKISVNVRDEGAFVIVSVSDSGNKLLDADIDAMRARLEKAKPSAENSGLENVHLRLRLRDEHGGIRLYRSALGGVRVELVIAREAAWEKGMPQHLSMADKKQNDIRRLHTARDTEN